MQRTGDGKKIQTMLKAAEFNQTVPYLEHIPKPIQDSIQFNDISRY